LPSGPAPPRPVGGAPDRPGDAGGTAKPAPDFEVARLTRFLRTPKGWLTLVFLPLLGVAGAALGWSAVLPHVAGAVAGACLADLALVRAKHGAWSWPSSALLSGLIVAFVLGLETPFAVTLAVGALSSVGKHALVLRRAHVFNPAALALLLSVPLFATGQSWWGALPDLPWPWLLVLLAAGVPVVDRLDKFPLALSFTGAYFGLFTLLTLTGWAPPAQTAELFRPPYLHAALFLALFMLTDPPTSPGRHGEQLAVGALVAAVAALAQLLGAGQSYLLVGLLAGNAALAGLRWSRRAASGAAGPGSSPGRPDSAWG
jgi:Na+-translocating ferredoxin:NAD+ oxidoreductase RnfD subunit